MSDQTSKNDGYWKDKLTPTEFNICRNKGTEAAFTGEYWDCKTAGVYKCKCCGEPLFSSSAKYDSGSGWPSFYEPLEKSAIQEHMDSAYGMVRTEIVCKQCDAHLGHVFTDGPVPTGLRYCVNSASLVLAHKELDDDGDNDDGDNNGDIGDSESE